MRLSTAAKLKINFLSSKSRKSESNLEPGDKANKMRVKVRNICSTSEGKLLKAMSGSDCSYSVFRSATAQLLCTTTQFKAITQVSSNFRLFDQH